MSVFKSKILLFLILAAASARADVPPVTEGALKKIDPDEIGIATVDGSDDLWTDASFRDVAGAFDKADPFVPTQGRMLRDLLATTAGKPADTPSSGAFLTARLNKLFALGFFGDVVELSKKIPPRDRTAGQDEAVLNALLVTDLNAACAFRGEKSDAVRLICAVSDQDEEEIYRLLDLLGEQQNDPFYAACANAFLNRTETTGAPVEKTPLAVAVMRKFKIPWTVGPDDPAWWRKAFAETAFLPPEKRLPVAEDLTEKGLFDPAKLNALYAVTGVLDNGARAAFSKTKNKNAFAAATEDFWNERETDLETLADCAADIEAFARAGLTEKADERLNKAELVFPGSPTVVKGWKWAEFHPKKERFFELRAGAGDPDGALRLFFDLGLFSGDEESALPTEKQAVCEPFGAKSRGLRVLNALNALKTDTVCAVRALIGEGFEAQALQMAAEVQP